MRAEQEISKIIKANLPQELSQYFLFDAMQSSELLKKNVFQQTIRDNFENVLGFKKYLQLKRASEKLQQEWAQQRLEAEQEAKEYNNLCSQKEGLVAEMNACLPSRTGCINIWHRSRTNISVPKKEPTGHEPEQADSGC